MEESPAIDELRKQFKKARLPLNTLHAFLRIPLLDTNARTFSEERRTRIVKFVAAVGGIREPDLRSIIAAPQSTLWRIISDLEAAGSIRVVKGYRDNSPGARPKWLQPPHSPDLSDDRREELTVLVERVKTYAPLWLTQQPAPAPKQQPAVHSPPLLVSAPPVPAQPAALEQPPLDTLPSEDIPEAAPGLDTTLVSSDDPSAPAPAPLPEWLRLPPKTLADLADANERFYWQVVDDDGNLHEDSRTSPPCPPPPPPAPSPQPWLEEAMLARARANEGMSKSELQRGVDKIKELGDAAFMLSLGILAMGILVAVLVSLQPQ